MVALGLESVLSWESRFPTGCAWVPSMSEFHFPLGISSAPCCCPLIWHITFPFPLKSDLSVSDHGDIKQLMKERKKRL